ncbi:TPA: zinc ribbon domain-containing protein [Streptococcus suis]|nr:zinc ribbon domain-containing protein [Streptococcus suis]
MSFINEITSKLADASALATQKTQELTQNVKVQNLVFKEKMKRDELLKTLGKSYCDKYKDIDGVEFQDIIYQITQSEETIKYYSADKTLKTLQCHSCDNFIEKDSTFCQHCGANLSDPAADTSMETVPEEPPTVSSTEAIQSHNSKFCTNCGATQHEGASFCVECGYNVK